MDKTNNEFCQYCNTKIPQNKFYIIYKIMVSSNKEVYSIGLQKVLEELGDYLMDRGSHLSASQVILLRPDIFKEYLKRKLFPENPIFWCLGEHEICYNCYAEYKKLIPEK